MNLCSPISKETSSYSVNRCIQLVPLISGRSVQPAPSLVLRFKFHSSTFCRSSGFWRLSQILVISHVRLHFIKDTEMSGGSHSMVIEICGLTQIVKFCQIFDSFSKSSGNSSTVSFISVPLNPVFQYFSPPISC